MARLMAPTAETSVRLYLLAEAEAFRDTLTVGQPSETYAAIWAALSGAVNALAAGEAYDIHRYQLPGDHPLAHRRAGEPHDWLTLGTDDCLTPAA